MPFNWSIIFNSGFPLTNDEQIFHVGSGCFEILNKNESAYFAAQTSIFDFFNFTFISWPWVGETIYTREDF